RSQVARARTAARTAGAQRLASSAYAAAVSAEREAQRLYGAGRAGDATVKFYEASGLFRTAEVTAQNEITRRDAAARADSMPAERADASRNTPLPPPPGASAPAESPPRVPPTTQPSV